MKDRNIINFYTTRGKYGCFSNFYKCQINMYDSTWKSAEHVFQAQKFMGMNSSVEDRKHANKIKNTNASYMAAKLGRIRNGPFKLRSDWEDVKVSIMEEILMKKFEQNLILKKILLKTDNKVIIEHTKNDNFWGDGGNGSGQNMLGISLMNVRNNLRNDIHNMTKKFDKLQI